jgi:hypothetical protein
MILQQQEKTLLDEANAIRAAESKMDIKDIRAKRAAAEEERMIKGVLLKII